MSLRKNFVGLILVATINLLVPQVLADGDIHREHYEPEIKTILDHIKAGELETALNLVDEHLDAFPKSRVGLVLRADILQSMVNNPLQYPAPEPTIKTSREDKSETPFGLREQIRNRWRHYAFDADIAHSKLPASLIDMGKHEHVLVSDMEAGRLYLYRNNGGMPELVRDYYLSVGSAGYGKQIEGDNKTPVGVYSIYQHIAGSELPDLYGKGAYPVNYPNVYDRALKRTGYGIWLHGTPSNTYARAPWASEGCFVLSNDDLLDVEKYIDVQNRTPVILADQVEWVTPEELEQRRQQLRQTIESWRQDWESLDTQAYLAHYSRDKFNFGRDDYSAWAKRKAQINAAKSFIQVEMEIDSLFLYPGETDMFVVQYKQRYLSNNYAGEARKQQFWQRDPEGQWRIIYES